MNVSSILSLRIPQLLDRAADHAKSARLDDSEELINEILQQLELFEHDQKADLKIFLEAWLLEIQDCKTFEEEEEPDCSSIIPWANAAQQVAKRMKEEQTASLFDGIWKVGYPKIFPIFRVGLIFFGSVATPIGLGIFLWIVYNLIFGFSEGFTKSGPEPFRQGVLLFLRIMGGLAWSICLIFFGIKWFQKGLSGKNTERPIYDFYTDKKNTD